MKHEKNEFQKQFSDLLLKPKVVFCFMSLFIQVNVGKSVPIKD